MDPILESQERRLSEIEKAIKGIFSDTSKVKESIAAIEVHLDNNKDLLRDFSEQTLANTKAIERQSTHNKYFFFALSSAFTGITAALTLWVKRLLGLE